MKNLRLFLLPFSFFYWLFIFIKNYLYDKNILQSRKVGTKIICIGNITTGGTGKTPITIAIANALLERNKKVAILSRGYKRKSKGFTEVDEVNSKKFGDEPAMMFSRLSDIKVYVSEDRVFAAEKIAESFTADFIIMDDGLQNRKIKKDYTIAVINEKRQYMLDNIYLPAGNMRESQNRLNNYDAVIRNYKFSRETVNTSPSGTFVCKYVIDGFYSNAGKKIPLDEILNKKVFAFCGIADPDSFFNALSNFNLNIAHKVSYNDHHDFTENDIDKLINSYRVNDCELAITTEKDSIRLTKHSKIIEQSEISFLHIKISAEIENLDRLMNKILQIS